MEDKFFKLKIFDNLCGWVISIPSLMHLQSIYEKAGVEKK